MPEEFKIKKSTIYAVGLMLIIIILAVYFVYYKPYYAPPRVVKYKYMENITAGFKIVDSTTGSLITSNVLAEIYPLGNNPFVKTFVNDSIATPQSIQTRIHIPKRNHQFIPHKSLA